MTTHIARIIPKLTDHGSSDIPASAWSPLAAALRRDFNAELRVHDPNQTAPYYVAVILPGDRAPEEVLIVVQYIDLIVDEIVAKYTHTEIPHAR